MPHALSNPEIADSLEQVAALLEAQGADHYRVRAYHLGAAAVRTYPEPMAEVAERGLCALEELPHVGPSLGSAIAELVHTGGLALLDRLKGAVSPADLFATLPGIGHELGKRIHEVLHVETLEELELAAHDGRLDQVEGIGPRRAEALREILASRLRNSARRFNRRVGEPAPHPDGEPSVALLLAVDARYRAQVAEDRLPKIAPRRMNESHAAWLPLMHWDSGGYHFTAMFSNTARAHQLGRTRDWVVIYYERGGREHQCTVVTEQGGPLRGARVVRGRESECLALARETGTADETAEEGCQRGGSERGDPAWGWGPDGSAGGAGAAGPACRPRQ